MDNATLAFSHYIEGDNDAFYEVVDLCNEKLIFYINRFINNLDISEEIAADCFVELVVHPKRFKYRSSILTYLLSIAHNKCVNYIRRNSKYKSVSLDEIVCISDEYKAFEDKIRQISDAKERTILELDEATTKWIDTGIKLSGWKIANEESNKKN